MVRAVSSRESKLSRLFVKKSFARVAEFVSSCCITEPSVCGRRRSIASDRDGSCRVLARKQTEQALRQKVFCARGGVRIELLHYGAERLRAKPIDCFRSGWFVPCPRAKAN